MRILVKFGGSVLYNDHNLLNIDLLKQFRDEIQILVEQGHQVAVVIGGGKATRKMVASLKNEELSFSDLDHISILMTQLHAGILRLLFGEYAMKKEFLTYNDLQQLNWDNRKIPVLGGLFPGQSTNGTAAICSEILGVDYFFNLFGYDYISSHDPSNGDGGSKLSKISYDKLGKLINNFKQIPGHYELFDHNALQFVKRSAIPVIFLNGTIPEQISAYLKSKNIGTRVGRY